LMSYKFIKNSEAEGVTLNSKKTLLDGLLA